MESENPTTTSKTQNNRQKPFPVKNFIHIPVSNTFAFGTKKRSVLLHACTQACKYCRLTLALFMLQEWHRQYGFFPQKSLRAKNVQCAIK